MAFERISLNIIPDGVKPVFHVSQFDTGRPIIIDLYNGDDIYTPAAGVTFELHCRKVDDNIVTLDTYEVDGNTITFVSTEQLCACSGDNLCEVAIMLDDLLMGTLNFILHVEPDPIAGGLTSETSIYNLTEQIEDIIEGEGYVKDTDLEVLQSDWNETDPTSPSYIKNKPGPALADQADWTETDPLKQSYIKHKPDLAAVATSGEYDDLLNKPTIPAAQVQSDWNQTNTSAVDFIKNKPDLMLIKSASGNPCTFTTDLTDNLISVKANITYNADGYTEANITRCGVNIWDEETRNGYYNTNGTFTADSNYLASKNYIPVVQNTQYHIESAGGKFGRICWYDKDKTFVSMIVPQSASINISSPANASYLQFDMQGAYGATYKHDISILYPSDTTFAYYPYTGNTYTIAFGQTVYGGVLDVTNGTLVSTLNADGTEKATPDIYTLTPTAIQALSGVNNIISDLGGDVEVKYVSGELAGQIIDICKMVIAEQGV
jgi:hypothetical protein